MERNGQTGANEIGAVEQRALEARARLPTTAIECPLHRTPRVSASCRAMIADLRRHVQGQYLRLATLQVAYDCISNAIAELPIFEHYSFDLDTLDGSVDGQKFGVTRPTAKARCSRKYFGRGKGVAADTLLCNHVPLQDWLVGAHEFEAHHVFDICYRITSDIVPIGDLPKTHRVCTLEYHAFHRHLRRARRHPGPCPASK
jgi:hypothetical protein